MSMKVFHSTKLTPESALESKMETYSLEILITIATWSILFISIGTVFARCDYSLEFRSEVLGLEEKEISCLSYLQKVVFSDNVVLIATIENHLSLH